MCYKIEGIVESLASDGSFTLRGTDGYRQEHDKESYNTFWEYNCDKISGKGCAKKISEEFTVPKDGRQWEFQLLLAAKTNNQKVLVEVKDGDINNSPLKIHRVSLVK